MKKGCEWLVFRLKWQNGNLEATIHFWSVDSTSPCTWHCTVFGVCHKILQKMGNDNLSCGGPGIWIAMC